MLDLKLVYGVFSQTQGYEGYKGWAFDATCYVVKNSAWVCSSSAFSRAFYSSVAIMKASPSQLVHLKTDQHIDFSIRTSPGKHSHYWSEKLCSVVLLKGDGLKCWSRTIFPHYSFTLANIHLENVFCQVQNGVGLDLFCTKVILHCSVLLCKVLHMDKRTSRN